MRRVLKVIDNTNEQMGRVFRWGLVVLVLIVSYEVMARYVFGAPTRWSYETDMMLSGTVYALAWAYALRHKAHVRIDLFYSRLSPRGKAIIDVIGALIAFFPLRKLHFISDQFHFFDFPQRFTHRFAFEIINLKKTF